MGFRDRFYTPQTARAILGWPIVAGVVAGGVAFLIGPGVLVAVGAGVIAYVGGVGLSMPRRNRVRIDPFTVQEPWRQFVQGAQSSALKLHETIERASDGPVKQRMQAVRAQLEHGLEETWLIARRGHEIDQAVHRLDPTALRAKLDALRGRPDATEGVETIASIESLESQLAGVDRLKEQSTRTANRLRLTQTRLDELVTRAAEVSVGAGDTDAYEHDVEDLVVELEGLRLAVEETRTA